MNHELTEQIKVLLKERCESRCMDDKDDFEAIIQVIDMAVEKWIDNRCPGCR